MFNDLTIVQRVRKSLELFPLLLTRSKESKLGIATIIWQNISFFLWMLDTWIEICWVTIDCWISHEKRRKTIFPSLINSLVSLLSVILNLKWALHFVLLHDEVRLQINQVCNIITRWLTDYQKASLSKDFTVGVSGGIDWVMVSTLCARTGLPVLLMKIQRSRAHVLWLTSNFANVTRPKVYLTEIFDTFEKIVFYVEVFLVNIRSRLWMAWTAETKCIQEMFLLLF